MEAKEALSALGGYDNHRSPDFNREILPRCRPLVEAIGYRIAFEAAKDLGVRPEILNLFEWLCVSEGLSWYVEAGVVTRSQFQSSGSDAYSRVLAILSDELKPLNGHKCITAPITNENSWKVFVENLPLFEAPECRTPTNVSKL